LRCAGGGGRGGGARPSGSRSLSQCESNKNVAPDMPADLRSNTFVAAASTCGCPGNDLVGATAVHHLPANKLIAERGLERSRPTTCVGKVAADRLFVRRRGPVVGRALDREGEAPVRHTCRAAHQARDERATLRLSGEEVRTRQDDGERLVRVGPALVCKRLEDARALRAAGFAAFEVPL
jgi:hypothetical protein